jgi:predicted DNA-binding protein
VPVRFPPETKRRLKQAQRRFNLNASEIIRRAVEQKLPEWESSGMIVLEGRAREGD